MSTPRSHRSAETVTTSSSLSLVHSRDDSEPTHVRDDGKKDWRNEFGILDRHDGPAVIHPGGREEWYDCGDPHRDGGPAITDPDGSESWYQEGRRHRDDGPAVTHPDGRQHWYQQDRLVSPPGTLDRLREDITDDVVAINESQQNLNEFREVVLHAKLAAVVMADLPDACTLEWVACIETGTGDDGAVHVQVVDVFDGAGNRLYEDAETYVRDTIDKVLAETNEALDLSGVHLDDPFGHGYARHGSIDINEALEEYRR